MGRHRHAVGMVARAEEACREVLTVLPAASPTLLADKSALQGLRLTPQQNMEWLV